MTQPSAREGTGLSPRVNSLEMKHPLVTRWKSSLKDTSAGSASSQGPGQAAAEEVGHTAASTPARPQSSGGSSHPIHGPGPRRGFLATISLGLHLPWESSPPWARGLAVNSTNTFLSPNHVPSLYSSYFLRLFSSHSLDRSILIQNPSWNLTRCLHMAELNKCLTKLQCEQHSTGSPFLSCFLLSRLSAVTFEPYQPPFHFLKHLIAANARSALSTRFLLQHFMVLSHLILMTSLMRRGPYVQSHFTHEERPGKV